MGVIAEGIPRGCQGLFTPASLGYPLSVFNKNSTLKDAGMDFSGGVKHWDKCKLRTALEWVVFTSRWTARLELSKVKVLDAGKNWK